MRAEVVRLGQEFDERTRWALQLNKELEDTKAVVARLNRELEERTEWALQLDRELREKPGLDGMWYRSRQLLKRAGAALRRRL